MHCTFAPVRWAEASGGVWVAQRMRRSSVRYSHVWSRFEWIIVYSLKIECASSTSAWITMHSTYTVSCNVPAVSVMLRLVACVNLYPSLFKPHLIVAGEGRGRRQCSTPLFTWFCLIDFVRLFLLFAARQDLCPVPSLPTPSVSARQFATIIQLIPLHTNSME
jgi:hypothetical protein